MDVDLLENPYINATSFKHLYRELLRHTHYRQGAIRKFQAAQFTAQWLRNNGTFRPCIILKPSEPSKAILQLPNPDNGTLLDLLLSSLGPAHHVETVDVDKQDAGPDWMLSHYFAYWNKRIGKELGSGSDANMLATTIGSGSSVILPDEVRLLTVLNALHLSNTCVAASFQPPIAVQAVDLHRRLLPSSSPPLLSMTLSMYPSKSFINSTLAPAGASAWFYVVSGAISFAIVPPTPKNLATYAAWAIGAQRDGVFLPSRCEGSAKADLVAGDTLLLPPGWSYAIAATASSVILRGAFLRSDSIAVHLDAMHIEQSIDIVMEDRYPQAWDLMWLAMRRYSDVLYRHAVKTGNESEDIIQQKIAARAAEMREQDSTALEAAKKTLERRRAAEAALAVQQANRFNGQIVGSGRRAANKRRRKANDAFIEEDQDEEEMFGDWGDSEDEEADWVPEKEVRGGSDMDDDENDGSGSDDEDEWEFDDDEEGFGEGRKKRTSRGREQIKPAGGRTSLRPRKGTRATVAKRVDSDEDYFDADEEEEEIGTASKLATSPVKLKIKLAGSASQPAAQQHIAPLSNFKLKLKLPTAPPPDSIPQIDGAFDDDDDDIFELAEGEEQSIAALLFHCRKELRTPETPFPPFSNHHEVLARLEYSIKALDIPFEKPMVTNVEAIEPRLLQVIAERPMQRALSFAQKMAGPDEEDGDETQPVSEEKVRPSSLPSSAPPPSKVSKFNTGKLAIESRKKAGSGAGGKKAPGATGGVQDKKAVALKKMSTKDRLRKKLGL